MAELRFNGRYFSTCYNDIKKSKGWLSKMFLLGLIYFIPVFGQMTLYGYAYEWAHKAAWKVDTPMPDKIYGRPNSKMLRWGWFALVISVVFALVPAIISGIAGNIFDAGSGSGFYTATGSYLTTSPVNPALIGLGWLFYVAAIVITVLAMLLTWAAIIRMTVYDRLGTGFQLGHVWEMVKRDFGGIMRIFGMYLLFSLIGVVVIGAVLLFVLVLVLGATMGPLLMVAAAGGYVGYEYLSYLLAAVVVALPAILIVCYFANVYSAFVEILTARAVGYWTSQFDVADWGTKDDPLPAGSNAYSQASYSQTSSTQSPDASAAQGTASSQSEAPKLLGQDSAAAKTAGTAGAAEAVVVEDDADDGSGAVVAEAVEEVETAVDEPEAELAAESAEVPPELDPVDVAEALDAEPDLPPAESEDKTQE